MSQSQENLRTDRRTEGGTNGRIDRQTLFYRTLPAEAGGPTRHFWKTKRSFWRTKGQFQEKKGAYGK